MTTPFSSLPYRGIFSYGLHLPPGPEIEPSLLLIHSFLQAGLNKLKPSIA